MAAQVSITLTAKFLFDDDTKEHDLRMITEIADLFAWSARFLRSGRRAEESPTRIVRAHEDETLEVVFSFSIPAMVNPVPIDLFEAKFRPAIVSFFLLHGYSRAPHAAKTAVDWASATDVMTVNNGHNVWDEFHAHGRAHTDGIPVVQLNDANMPTRVGLFTAVPEGALPIFTEQTWMHMQVLLKHQKCRNFVLTPELRFECRQCK